MQPVSINPSQGFLRGSTHLEILVHERDDQVLDGRGVAVESDCGGSGLADVRDGIAQERQ